LTGLVAIGLVVYSIIKWAMKGDIFHPGLVYSIINGGIYIVFVFGPYFYTKPVPEIYCYMYVFIICIFVHGIVLGNARGLRKPVKQIKLTPLRLFILYWLLVFLILMSVVPLIISTGGSLEGAVENRFQGIETASDISNSNPVAFVLTNTILSFFQINTALITSAVLWQRRNYQRIALLILLNVLYALFLNSRTQIVFSLILTFVPIYIVLKERGVIDLSKIKKLLKNIKFIAPFIVIAGLAIFTLTNIRSSVISGDLENSSNVIESIYHAKKKESFKKFISEVSPELSNPISELSLYAGGTVWFGGIATDIVIGSGLNTWGTRSLNSIHRIIDRSGLDGGFANWARENYTNIVAIGPFGFGFSWWGDPANFIVDYGLIGAPVAAIIIGWIIGWMYGRMSNGGIILKSTGTVIILLSIILTPAVSPFGFFPNFINLSLLGIYLRKKSYKNYLPISKLGSNNKNKSKNFFVTQKR
jgi:hypothetical protein